MSVDRNPFPFVAIVSSSMIGIVDGFHYNDIAFNTNPQNQHLNCQRGIITHDPNKEDSNAM